MNQDLKNEAIEQLKKDILFGFEDSKELFANISEMFYDEEHFDEDWLVNEIKIRLKKHTKESQSWEKPTDFDKLVKSFDELNKQKIVAIHKAGYTRQDGEGDCLEIIHELKDIGISAKGYCFYHTQDLERAIGEEKVLFLGYDSHNQEDKLAYQVANTIIEVLKSNGLRAEWNDSLDSRIEILDFNWRKTVDNIDYGFGRVIEIMEQQKKIENSASKKKKPFWKIW